MWYFANDKQNSDLSLAVINQSKSQALTSSNKGITT
ncbi:hypothetical protein SAMN05428975_3986 [Mucilaginibacter sp. OK268]|nr:hypothetical protein SAMN05428975_3986 [Mucilaginibacter sp. OK268]